MSFQSLLSQYKEIKVLESVGGILHWDRDVYMPSESDQIRMLQEQSLALSVQAKFLDSDFNNAFLGIENSKLSEIEKRQFQLIVREQAMQNAIPKEFLKEFIQKQNQCYSAFKKAKESSDFSIVKKEFQDLIPFYQKIPELLKKDLNLQTELSDKSNYEVLIHCNYDPGLKADVIEKSFSELKEFLIEFRKTRPVLQETISDRLQIDILEVSQKVCKSLGFDFKKGRIDITPIHPFCGGSLGDVRLTTKMNYKDPLDSLYSTLHEVGHGLYQQNLPKEFLFEPLGYAASASIHESQSRFVENQIGRTAAFLDFLSPLVGTDSKFLQKEILSHKESFIRVDADEIDYNLHIILRWELEQLLLKGDLSVSELPKVWNDRFEKYFGMKVPDDRHGCLQDIHWYAIGFGYFPSYTIGNIFAAQLFDKFQLEHPNWEDKVRSGELVFVNHWLRAAVHSKGSRWDVPETIQSALGGKSLEVKSLIRYLQTKYQ